MVVILATYRRIVTPFYWLPKVSLSDLHKPDMLHTVYLGIFKHMMNWIQGFLKKHGQLDAFDEVWKTLPPYPGFLVPKKGYRKATQSQGKEMRNLGGCILGVLTVVVCQPGSAQILPFKHALQCAKVLADFKMIVHYRSHTSETIAYMEDYLDRFHQMKDILREYQVTKRTRTKIDKQCSELPHHRAQRERADRTLETGPEPSLKQGRRK